MGELMDLPGAAHLVLADGVVHLDPAEAVFEATLEGWARQQRTRFLNVDGTINPRLTLVRRFAEFTGDYPWRWRAEDVEAFVDWVRARRREQGRGFAVSTGRNYQNGLRLFGNYVTDARYGWPARCVELFGEAPAQILHEWNTVTHTSDYEGNPGRRPLTYDEVQVLFDAADGRVEQIRSR
ncbi:MAG TPA: site-specific integrase, partial [Kribbella sp.]